MIPYLFSKITNEKRTKKDSSRVFGVQSATEQSDCICSSAKTEHRRAFTRPAASNGEHVNVIMGRVADGSALFRQRQWFTRVRPRL